MTNVMVAMFCPIKQKSSNAASSCLLLVSMTYDHSLHTFLQE